MNSSEILVNLVSSTMGGIWEYICQTLAYPHLNSVLLKPTNSAPVILFQQFAWQKKESCITTVYIYTYIGSKTTQSFNIYNLSQIANLI